MVNHANISSAETSGQHEKSHESSDTSSHRRILPKRRKNVSKKALTFHRPKGSTITSLQLTKTSGRNRSTRKKKLMDLEYTELLLRRARQRAKKLASRKEGDAAIYEFIKSLALTRIVYGEEHWRLAYAHVLLADAYVELKEYGAQALEHAECARSIMLITPDRPRSARKKADLLKVTTLVYLVIGKSHMKLGKHRIAQQNLEQAARLANDYSLATKIPIRNTKALNCKVLLAIARLELTQKKYNDSCRTYKQLLSLTEDIYGVDSVQAIHIHQRLGTVYQQIQQPNHDAALDHFKAAIEIGTSRYEPESKELARAELFLAKAYLATNEEMAKYMAETHLQNILTCLEDKRGSRELLYFESVDLLVSLLIVSCREKEAIALITSSVVKKRRVFGTNSSQLIMALKLLGSLHLSIGEISPAIKYLKKCLEIELIVFGPNHVNVNDTRQTLRVIHQTPLLPSTFCDVQPETATS